MVLGLPWLALAFMVAPCLVQVPWEDPPQPVLQPQQPLGLEAMAMSWRQLGQLLPSKPLVWLPRQRRLPWAHPLL